MKTILDVRKFWNERPCNVRHSPAPIGSKQWIIETEQRKRKVEPHIAEFAKFDQWFDKKVLEIGCGIGIDTVSFARTGARVTAIDLSDQSVEIAYDRARMLGVKAKFYCGNAEDLNSPFTLYDYYDLVYAFGSIHHSPSPEAIIGNARYVLKPGGTLKIMVYSKYSWKSLWVLLKYGHGKFWKFRELIAKYSEAQTGCPVTHVYSPRELRAMLERNGFIVRKMYKAHIFPWRIPEYREYKYVKAFPWNICPQWLFTKLEALFGWHLLCEAQAC